MVGTTVLYHPAADADGIVALVVGVNTPDDPATQGETINLVVFPDVDTPAGDMAAADPPADDSAAADAPTDDASFDGWAPYRVSDVARDQPGDATTAYWSPIPA